MVYKGSIIKEEKDHIIVLTEDCQYKKLKKKGLSQLGKEIMFIEDDIIKNSFSKGMIKYKVAAAVILFAITTAMLVGLNFGLIDGLYTYAVVSLDINPSIEFRINDRAIVNKVIPLNEEGRDVINSEMVGMNIKDAISLGINNAIDKEYLTYDNNTVLISEVKLKDFTQEELNIKNSILQSIKDNNKADNVDLVYVESNEESFKEAEKNNMSVGKYELYKRILEKNKNVTIENIKEMKVTEITRANAAIVEAFKIGDFNKNYGKNKKDKDEKQKDDEKQKYKYNGKFAEEDDELDKDQEEDAHGENKDKINNRNKEKNQDKGNGRDKKEDFESENDLEDNDWDDKGNEVDKNANNKNKRNYNSDKENDEGDDDSQDQKDDEKDENEDANQSVVVENHGKVDEEIDEENVKDDKDEDDKDEDDKDEDDKDEDDKDDDDKDDDDKDDIDKDNKGKGKNN